MRRSQLEIQIDRLFDGIEDRAVKAFSDANKTLAEELRKEAVWYSSGTTSAHKLRQLDYPFATRHGSPQLETAVLNAQTGRLRASWQIWPTRGTSWAAGRERHPRVRTYMVVNTAPYASFLEEGTKIMFARDIGDPLLAWAELHAPGILIKSLAAQGFYRFT